MEAKQNLRFWNWIKLLSIYFIILLALFIFYLAQDLLTPFLIAFILIYILNPVADKLEGTGLRRSFVIPMIFIGFFLVLALIVIFSYDSIIYEIDTLKTKIPEYLNKIRTSFEENAILIENNIPMLPKGYLQKAINEKAGGIPRMIGEQIPVLIKASLGLITSVLVILFTTFFILKDGRSFRKNIIKIVPNKYFETVLVLLNEINLKVGGYVRGQMIDCAIVAMLSIIGLSMIGLKYAIIIGLISGITNIVPYLGPVMGMVPGIFIAIIDHHSPIMAVWVVIVLICVQMIDNILVSPLAVGKSVNLHPLAVIISVTVGGAIMGIWGMLLAVPIFCALKVTFEVLYKGIIEYGSWENQ